MGFTNWGLANSGRLRAGGGLEGRAFSPQRSNTCALQTFSDRLCYSIKVSDLKSRIAQLSFKLLFRHPRACLRVNERKQDVLCALWYLSCNVVPRAQSSQPRTLHATSHPSFFTFKLRPFVLFDRLLLQFAFPVRASNIPSP